MGCVRFDPTKQYGTFDAAKACTPEDARQIIQSRGTGLHINTAAKVAIGVGVATASGGIATGVLTLAGAAARKESAPAPEIPETPLVPQTLNTLGGSAGTSATPIIPNRNAGIIPGVLPTVVNMGLDWLNRRVNPTQPREGFFACSAVNSA